MRSMLLDNTSAIILSAGSSSRMGVHKALLPFDKSKTFIRKITDTYVQAGAMQVIVVVDKELYEEIGKQETLLSNGVRLVVNLFPEYGRFYSLNLGNQQLIQDCFCFFQNIDNPFTSAELLTNMSRNKAYADVIVPCIQKHAGHPVLFSPKVAKEISLITDWEMRIDEFFRRFDSRKIEVADSRILTNINTLEEYREAGFGI